jgi:hypothetical protein
MGGARHEQAVSRREASPFQAPARGPLLQRISPVAADLRADQPGTLPRDLLAGLTVAALGFDAADPSERRAARHDRRGPQLRHRPRCGCKLPVPNVRGLDRLFGRSRRDDSASRRGSRGGSARQ